MSLRRKFLISVTALGLAVAAIICLTQLARPAFDDDQAAFMLQFFDQARAMDLHFSGEYWAGLIPSELPFASRSKFYLTKRFQSRISGIGNPNASIIFVGQDNETKVDYGIIVNIFENRIRNMSIYYADGGKGKADEYKASFGKKFAGLPIVVRSSSSLTNHVITVYTKRFF